MGANIWFWLIYVLVGVFGIFGISPWSGDRLGSWGPFGSWLVLFILTGILGLSVYGSPMAVNQEHFVGILVGAHYRYRHLDIACTVRSRGFFQGATTTAPIRPSASACAKLRSRASMTGCRSAMSTCMISGRKTPTRSNRSGRK